MKILDQVLNKIKPIHKKQRDFVIILIQGLIGIVGKRTFRNLARYMQITEHTFSRQMAKDLDFIGINRELIESSKNSGDILIAAQDASFIAKAGKKTDGLHYFWNSCSGKTQKGIEVDAIVVVKINEKRETYTLSAQQTPINCVPKIQKKTTDLSKIDFYLNHLKKVSPTLVGLGIQYVVADAFFAKIKYVDGVVAMELQLISKLRIDARLRRLYSGPQKARGRRKRFDVGKINSDDFIQSLVTKVEGDATELRSCTAYSVSLKRTIKVVSVRKKIDKDRAGEVFLFSTDLKLSDLQIYQFYKARFQIEFIFRDAKGFTGLGDCQSRDHHKIEYHFNASLMALNVAKIEDAELQKKQRTPSPFSMASCGRKYHVNMVINRFITMLGFDQTSIKLHPNFNDMLTFGSIIH